MGKKAIKKRIESLLNRIREHELKIQNKKMKEPPNYGLIHHWEAEIVAFRVSIERAEKRLKS